MPEAESLHPQEMPDEVDVLLDQVLAAPEGSWTVALDRLCREFPEHARSLRQRFGYLRRCGMVAVDGDSIGEGGPGSASVDGPPAAGSPFGPYDLLAILGHGAMGIVFRAVHRQTGALVAVKVIRPELLEEPAARRRFLNEGEVAARLEHPHLCRVHEVGEVEGTPFLAMDLLGGETLASRLERARRRGRPLAHGWPGVVALFEKVARGLGSAHAMGLVHRDVKPGNLMLGADGEPVLFDFGLALRAETTRWTRTGTALGTPAYMPPEQVRGSDRITPRADVYALGASLYEALALRPPFGLVEREVLYRRILHDDADNLCRLVPHLPRALGWVVHRCLEKDPRRRYADAGGLAEDLERVRLGRRTEARPLGPIRRLARLVRYRPVVASLLLASLFALLALSVLAVHLQRTAETQATLAAIAAEQVSGYDPMRGLLMARELFERQRTSATRSALVAAMLGAYQDDEVRTEHFLLWAAASTDTSTLLCSAWDPEGGLDQETQSTGPAWSRVLVRGGYCGAVALDGRFAIARVGQPPQLYDVDGEEIPLTYYADGEHIPLAEMRPPVAFSGTRISMWRPSIAFDGDNLLAGDRRGRVLVFDRQGTLIHEWRPHGDRMIYGLWPAADGRVWTVGVDDTVSRSRPEVRLSSATDPAGEPLFASQDHGVAWAASSGDERRLFLAIGSDDMSSVVQLDVDEEGWVEYQLPGIGWVTALAADRRGEFVVVGGDKQVVLIDTENDTRRLIETLESEVSFATMRDSEEDSSSYLAVAEHRGPIHLWSLPLARPVAVLRGHKQKVEYLQFTLSGDELVSASQDGTARLWNLVLPWLTEVRAAAPMFACSWCPDGEHLATVAGAELSLWHRRGRRLATRRLTEGRGLPVSVAIAPSLPASDTCMLAVGGDSQPLSFWTCNPETDNAMWLQHGHVDTQFLPKTLRFAGRHELTAVGPGGRVAIYDPSGTRIWVSHEIPTINHVVAAAVSPDARWFARSSGKDATEVWEILRDADGNPTGGALAWSDPAPATALAFDPAEDGSLLVGRSGGEVVLVDSAAGGASPICRHERMITTVAFSPDSGRILSAGYDGIVRVHTRDGEPIVDLPHGGIVWDAAFSPDGRHVLSCSSVETARVWPIDDDALLRFAEDLAFREWDPGERERLLGVK